MTKNLVLAALFVLATGSSAHAGGQEGSLGVGAEFGLIGAFDADIGGLGGASLNYDAGKFHVGGFLGFADADGPDNTVFSLGGRFYYHVHSTAMSDFGVGGNIGILSIPAGNDERNTLLFIEPGIQIRTFLAANVALSFNVGIVLGAADASGTFLGGHTTGSAGIHYYFF